jgi:hypothetical protein
LPAAVAVSYDAWFKKIEMYEMKNFVGQYYGTAFFF